MLIFITVQVVKDASGEITKYIAPTILLRGGIHLMGVRSNRHKLGISYRNVEAEVRLYDVCSLRTPDGTKIRFQGIHEP